jgi:hypothetical protein
VCHENKYVVYACNLISQDNNGHAQSYYVACGVSHIV